MNIWYVTGFAGTGKSTTLLKLLKKANPLNTVVLCPTHKAIKRLVDNMKDIAIEVKTIHSILGWVPGINESAEHINHIDVTIKLDRTIDSYKTIVIDEGGMMSEDMFMEITAKLEEAHSFDTSDIEIYVFLDPYQLLPVKGKQIQIDESTTKHLTKQHRAESPDLVSLFTKFVHFVEGKNKKDLKIMPSENVIFINRIDDFNPNTDRLLAYTNECVGHYNQIIANKLGIKSYEGQMVQLGNYSLAVKVDKFIQPNINRLLAHYEAGTLWLQNSQINPKFVKESLKALIDHNDIQFIQVNEVIVPVVVGIHNANLVKKLAKQKAVEDKSNFKWLYALDRAFTMDYTFASTVHKSQGSEFERVFIVKEDIQKAIINNYYDTYARLMYVALSRAKKKVFII